MSNESDFTRRDFFRALGASGAAATLVGCGAEPPEKLIPYLIPAEESIPGTALWYATVCRECPAGCGMVMKTREGRAVKAEGNPAHPINRGALCARGQASLQGLYNPDRVREPMLRGVDGKFRPASWEDAEKRVIREINRLRIEGGADRIALITSPVGPSLRELIDRWMGALGSQKRFVFEPLSFEGIRSANQSLFGLATVPSYSLEKCESIISFGADFLETWLSPVEHARGFSAMRSYRDGKIGRFYYVGPRLSLTGANADEWIPMRPGTEAVLALGMIHVILSQGLYGRLRPEEKRELAGFVKAYPPERVSALAGVPQAKVVELARAFAANRPSLALGGTGGIISRGALTEKAVALLNYVAGNMGDTVHFHSYSSMDAVSPYGRIVSLIDEMERGDISALFVHGANPVFALPERAGFKDALKKVPFKAAFAQFLDETAAEMDLILPVHDPLESWGDYSPREGVYSLMQPVMRPLFQTSSFGDALLSLARRTAPNMARQFPWPSFYDYLRESWRALQSHWGEHGPFESFWQEALRKGGVWKEGTRETVRLRTEALRTPAQEPPLESNGGPSTYLHVYPSIAHYDGRGANRPWLQELPDPVTQITWDSWVEIHPQIAHTLGIVEGSVLRVTSPHGTIEAPAHLYEGIRPDTVALPFGQGHTAFGRYAANRGANPVSLLGPKADPGWGNAPVSSLKVRLEDTGRRHPLASTAGSTRQEGRGIAQAVGLSAVGRLGEGTRAKVEELPQFRPAHPHPENRWGMVVDLNACTGCSACMVACSAENNVPAVGRENVLSGREMFWIRIERYAETNGDQIDNRFVPMLCQQCDHAPCEPVCPVYATYHRADGLNAQVYNRCIGTRYCSNNCPYKVRRFNWFDYEWAEPLNLQLNPDLSVRSKGVMEKCTFCVQRIRGAKDRAKDEGRSVRDGEVTPACVQTCPANALVFGDLKDPESKVSKMARDPRGYRILEDLNTQPAITYLKKIRRDDEA